MKIVRILISLILFFIAYMLAEIALPINGNCGGRFMCARTGWSNPWAFVALIAVIILVMFGLRGLAAIFKHKQRH